MLLLYYMYALCLTASLKRSTRLFDYWVVVFGFLEPVLVFSKFGFGGRLHYSTVTLLGMIQNPLEVC